MKTLSFHFCIFLLSGYSSIAQNNNEVFAKDFNRAEKIFSKVYQDGKDEAQTYSKGGYSAALPIFLRLYKLDSTNKNIAFKLGVCYLSSRKERALAIPYFLKAVTAVSYNYKGSSFKEKNAPLIAIKFLGDAYHLDYQFDKAIETYERFKTAMAEKNIAIKATLTEKIILTDKVLIDETNRKIEMCKTAKVLMGKPVNVLIENLGNTLNSPYADYSPVLSADQTKLFFTSRRPETMGIQKDDDGNYMEDIFTAHKTETGWSSAENIGVPINTDWHEATVGISPDGQTILIYKDDLGDGNIYSTTLDGDVWSTPVKLNENINSKYWEPSAFISADGNSLYFTSNRPGGFGGRDLYVSKKAQNGDWGIAANMGARINTAFDEEAPFIHPDGVSFSFSSNGHSTMGGFDIFTSLLSDTTWSEPVNVGYPINTTDDDIYYVVSPDSRTAYFTSFREGGFGEKDNYVATFLDRKEAPLTLMKGDVLDELGKPAQHVNITVTDNETGNVVGVYHTNSKTGTFLFILTPDKNYNITYQAKDHLFYSENMEIPVQTNYYEIKRAVTLDPIVVGSKIILNNIFFDFDKATLRAESNVELMNLVLLMKSNPNLKVEIAGYTDNKGGDEYNKNLSEERAKAVVARLIASGISPNRMKAIGYGMTMPIASNSMADGTDNPEGRQLNRRVEFRITEIK